MSKTTFENANGADHHIRAALRKVFTQTAEKGRKRMATTSALYRNPVQPVKFNREFLERRMREHQELRQQLASEGAGEIIHEVVGIFTCFPEIRTDEGAGKIARMR